MPGNPTLWEDGLRQTTAERTYAEVFTNEHLGVWVISWMADGHDTGFHDHDGLLHRTATDVEEQLKPHGYQGTPTG